MLSYELSSCHSSITSLKSLNDDLNARIEKVNVVSSSIEHVSICAKCKDHVLMFVVIMVLLLKN